MARSDPRLAETSRRVRITRNTLARHWAVIRKLEREGASTAAARALLATVEQTFERLQAEREEREARSRAPDCRA